jgi:cysteine desulfuration protein SufE
MPAFPDKWRTDENKVRGCQSQVWLKTSNVNGTMAFQAISDSAIVSGLIAILTRVYSNRNPHEIVATPPDFIKAIGLDEHLSPTRSNGLHSMIRAIKKAAAERVSDTA